MASYNKTQYIDSISVRNIYARGPNNTTLPSDTVLVTDGNGGTIWEPIASLQGGGAFTTITTTPSTFQAKSSAPFFSIVNGPNAGLTVDPTAPNQVKLFANAYNQIAVEIPNVSQGSQGVQTTTLSAYDNPTDIYTSTLTFTQGDGIELIPDPSVNRIKFNVYPSRNATVSTLSSIIWNMSTLNASFQTELTNFSSPYGSQPFIQCGFTTLSNDTGSASVQLATPYTSPNYTAQVTYQRNPSDTTTVYTKPLSVSIQPNNTFRIFGDAGRQVVWTTFGSVF